MRLLAGACAQEGQRQVIFMSPRWNTPRVPLQVTLICVGGGGVGWGGEGEWSNSGQIQAR